MGPGTWDKNDPGPRSHTPPRGRVVWSQFSPPGKGVLAPQRNEKNAANRLEDAFQEPFRAKPSNHRGREEPSLHTTWGERAGSSEHELACLILCVFLQEMHSKASPSEPTPATTGGEREPSLHTTGGSEQKDNPSNHRGAEGTIQAPSLHTTGRRRGHNPQADHPTRGGGLRNLGHIFISLNTSPIHFESFSEHFALCAAT